MYIFKCKTAEAFNIKILAELLSNNLKTGCFEISKAGIYLRMFDNNRKTLVDLNLESINFTFFKFKSETKICVGLNLNHFYKMLKSIKKKDSLELIIEQDKPYELYIKTIPKENTRITTSSIKIQMIQNLDIELPEEYNKPIIISSSEFHKMCKDLISIGSSNIKVLAKNYKIEFLADVDGILQRKVEFGSDEEESGEDENENETKNNDYLATFDTDRLSRINKIAGLSTFIHIYTSNNKEIPLLLKTNVGNLGNISIIIKSNEIVQEEMLKLYNSSSDEE